VNIYTAAQIKEWDAYTIQHEPIASIDLMERAAQKCVDWIEMHIAAKKTFTIFCGKGNNGGDGLAIARLLYEKGFSVAIYILDTTPTGSKDFETNLQRLHAANIPVHMMETVAQFPDITDDTIVIDALFGSGLNKPLTGLAADLVQHINQASHYTISIDVPSGLFMDQSSIGYPVVKATDTVTFQSYKTALLVAENAAYFGKVHILDIGLHPGYIRQYPSSYQLVHETIIKKIFQPRKDFAHKGTYGHALLMTGSYGKMGASVLTISACLRSGAGLVTAYIPQCGYTILQTAAPEAMTITDAEENHITEWPNDIDKYEAIGIGPGLGMEEATKAVVTKIITRYKKPMVVDADGLNALAAEPERLQHLPSYSILTPHPKEFERLFGTCANDFERMNTALQKAKELSVIIVLKGHHTFIALPDGTAYFNNTGNAGMAKGGSGDVLTGILPSLLAQGFATAEAAILGVYIHGLAGDLAAQELSKEAMIAGDIVRFLSKAFLYINKATSY
jgi:NAD(P)H-hydrate epimerase